MFMLTIDSGDPEFDKVQKNPYVEVFLAILCVMDYTELELDTQLLLIDAFKTQAEKNEAIALLVTPPPMIYIK